MLVYSVCLPLEGHPSRPQATSSTARTEQPMSLQDKRDQGCTVLEKLGISDYLLGTEITIFHYCFHKMFIELVNYNKGNVSNQA